MNSIESYINRIQLIREDLSAYAAEAWRQNRPVDERFYEAEKQLARTFRNMRAYAKRHHIDLSEYAI